MESDKPERASRASSGTPHSGLPQRGKNKKRANPIGKASANNPRIQTKLVGAVHMSNALGTIVPIEELIALAQEHGALTVIDGAQSVPHMPVAVQAQGADFLAFSAHKMLGPTGIGALWGRMELLELRIDPQAVDPRDVEMLQDLIVAAVNQVMTLSGISTCIVDDQ